MSVTENNSPATPSSGVPGVEATSTLVERQKRPWPHGPRNWLKPPDRPVEPEVTDEAPTPLAAVAVPPMAGRHRLRKVDPPSLWERLVSWLREGAR